jgi:hypothetical protein
MAPRDERKNGVGGGRQGAWPAEAGGVGVRLLGRPGEKENGPDRRGIVNFLFIQIFFK